MRNFQKNWTTSNFQRMKRRREVLAFYEAMPNQRKAERALGNAVQRHKLWNRIKLFIRKIINIITRKYGTT